MERITLDQLCVQRIETIPASYKGLIDYVDISSVDNERKTIVSHQKISNAEAPSRAKQLIQKGDILVSTVRPNLNAVAMYDGTFENTAVASTGYCILRCKEDVDSKFVYYFTQSSYFVDDMIKQATGASYPAVSNMIVKNSKIPAYEKETKKRIVKELDALFRLIDWRKQQLEKLDELVKARFVELTEATNAIPTRMGDIATYINGYAFKPTQWEKSGLPIIRIQNLNDPNAAFNYFSGELAAKYLIHNGDVLVSWATHLEAYIWNGEEAWLNQHIFKVVFNKMEVNKVYYVYACEEALRQAFRNAHGFKPTMEHIKKADFDDAIVKLPDLHTQEQFAAFVEQTDKSKVEIQKSLEQMETLKKALLQKYFG